MFVWIAASAACVAALVLAVLIISKPSIAAPVDAACTLAFTATVLAAASVMFITTASVPAAALITSSVAADTAPSLAATTLTAAHAGIVLRSTMSDAVLLSTAATGAAVASALASMLPAALGVLVVAVSATICPGVTCLASGLASTPAVLWFINGLVHCSFRVSQSGIILVGRVPVAI
jgi:hypothetical protein